MRISKNQFPQIFKRLLNSSKFHILIIFFVSLIFFAPVFFQNKLPLPLDALVGAHTPWIEIKWDGYEAGVPIKNQEITDAISQFYPWRSLVGEFWRSGQAPLWNRYMLSGIPFLATLHSAAIYPLNSLYLFFDDPTSWTMLLFFQIFLSGTFMYLFLRELELKGPSSLFGSISFMFCGYMIAWLEFATGGHAGLWLPLLLYSIIKYVNSSDQKWRILTVVSFFFIFTAGDFQVPMYVSFVYIVFILFLKWNFSLKNKFVFEYFLMFAAGIFASSVQLLPTIDLFLKSQRAADPYIREYYFGLMDFHKITNFIWPDFYGNVVTRNYWTRFGFHEYISYVGILPLLFAAYSLVAKKVRIEYFFWAVLLVSLLFLFPTPFGFLPYKLEIPALSTSSASRIIFIVDFCLSVLAAYGFNKVINSSLSKIWRTLFYFMVVTIGIFSGLYVSYVIMKAGNIDFPMIVNLRVAMKNMLPQTVVIVLVAAIVIMSKTFSRIPKAVWILILLTISTLDLLRFAWKNTPFSERRFLFPETKTTEFLKEDKEAFRIAGPGIPMNYFMQYGISSANGYEPIYPLVNGLWFSKINFDNYKYNSGRYGEISNFCSPYIGYSNVKYVIDYRKDPTDRSLSDRGELNKCLVDNENYHPVFSERRVTVFENNKYLPKVWVGKNIVFTSDTEFKEMDGVVDKDLTIVILGKGDNSDATGSGIVSNFRQDFNKINFEVMMENSGYVFLSESYDEGWKIYIDGKKDKIYRANYLYQAFRIEKGSHKISLVYQPFSFILGLSLSVFAGMFSGLYIVMKRFGNQKAN